MATWKEVISNLSGYPDDLKIKIAEGVEVPLGELREASKGEMAELEKQRKEMNKRQQEIDAATLRVADMYAKGELTTAQAQAASETITQAQPQAYDYNSDQYIGPVYKEVQSLSAALKASAAQNDALRQQVASLYSSITTDRYATDYEKALSAEDRQLLGDSPLPAFEDVIRHAQENGLVDARRRTLNITRAMQDMVSGKIQDAKIKAARDAGREEGIKEAGTRAAAVNAVRPNRLGKEARTIHEVNGKRVKTISDAVDAAANDPEIAGALSNIGQIQ